MKLLTNIITALCCVLSISYVHAAPASIHQVIIPFAPGGGVDQAFRHLQHYAEQQRVVLVPVYKPGAEGLIAMNDLVTGDNKTVALVTSGVLAYYSIKEPRNSVKIISGVRTSVMVMVTGAGNRIKSLSDLEQKITSGIGVNFASGAPAQRMIIDQYLERTSAVAGQTVVQYKGAGPIIKDLLGDHVDIAVVPLSTVKTQIDAGKLRVIAIASGRADEFKVPTLSDKYQSWKEFDGMTVVSGSQTSSKTIDFWTELLKNYLSDTNVKSSIIADHAMPMSFGTDQINSTVKNNVDRMKINAR